MISYTVMIAGVVFHNCSGSGPKALKPTCAWCIPTHTATHLLSTSIRVFAVAPTFINAVGEVTCAYGAAWWPTACNICLIHGGHIISQIFDVFLNYTQYFDICQSTGYSIITGTAKFNIVCQYWINLESFQILWIRMRTGIIKSSILDFFPRPIFWFTDRNDETFCSPR